MFEDFSTSTPTLTESTTSSISSRDANSIFRTPKEVESGAKNKKFDDVMEITPPPMILATSEDESIVEESFDLFPILLKHKNKDYLKKIKFRPFHEMNAPSTEYKRVVLKDELPVIDDKKSEVQSIIDNPMYETIRVRVSLMDVFDYGDDCCPSIVQAFIYGTEQRRKSSLFSPLPHKSKQSSPSRFVVVDFDESWRARPFVNHLLLVQNMREVIHTFISTENVIIQMIDAPFVVRLLWNTVLRWQFLPQLSQVCFESVADVEKKNDDVSAPCDLEAITRRLMQGGLLSDGYVSERIKL